MKRIYMDYAATTPMHPDVAIAMNPYYTDNFGNPSSIHSFGRDARKAMDGARDNISAFIGARSDEIIFTSGGTEADNFALEGAARTGRALRRGRETAAQRERAARRAARTGRDLHRGRERQQRRGRDLHEGRRVPGESCAEEETAAQRERAARRAACSRRDLHRGRERQQRRGRELCGGRRIGGESCADGGTEGYRARATPPFYPECCTTKLGTVGEGMILLTMVVFQPIIKTRCIREAMLMVVTLSAGNCNSLGVSAVVTGAGLRGCCCSWGWVIGFVFQL